VYREGATDKAAYAIQIIDSNGDVRDQMGSELDSNEKLPYRDDFDLRVEVA
jgi:hypothetical protein